MTPPAKPSAVKRELDELVGGLLELGVVDDANFSVLKRNGRCWDITFSGDQHVSLAMGDLEYAEIHRELSGLRSYNVKLIDGALLQLMYSFHDDCQLQHRLAFYPSPTLLPFRDDSGSYMQDEMFLEIVARRIVPFPIRFDYDDRIGVHIDVSHPKSHLTLGDVKGCRIPVTAPITPRWFFDFILRSFYQTERHDFVSGLPKHRIQFDTSITPSERRIVHLSIPELG